MSLLSLHAADSVTRPSICCIVNTVQYRAVSRPDIALFEASESLPFTSSHVHSISAIPISCFIAILSIRKMALRLCHVGDDGTPSSCRLYVSRSHGCFREARRRRRRCHPGPVTGLSATTIRMHDPQAVLAVEGRPAPPRPSAMLCGRLGFYLHLHLRLFVPQVPLVD
jgi:hypothetical protein